MTSKPERYGLVAGNGLLPVKLVERLRAMGQQPSIVGIEGECDPSLTTSNDAILPLEKIAYALPILKKAGANRIIFAGGVKRRPKISALRVPIMLWPDVPSVVLALNRGDDSLLVAVVKMFERRGLKIIGAHTILPDHVAPFGVAAGTFPDGSYTDTIRTGVAAADIIGGLDIGQSVVVTGRRIIAVEGIEGTDQMLKRVASFRVNGQIDANAKPVLIKLAKPGQELRTDMPVIGPKTIENCVAAGIALICISANTTLIMESEQTLQTARAAGISIIGIDPADWGGSKR